MSGRVLNGHIPIIGQTRRPHPAVGSVFPIPVDGGVVLFKVEKASVYRTTLVPLSEQEEHELVAALNLATYARAGWRLCAVVSVCAAFIWQAGRMAGDLAVALDIVDAVATEPEMDAMADAITAAHPLQCPYYLGAESNRCVRKNDGHGDEEHAFPEVPTE